MVQTISLQNVIKLKHDRTDSDILRHGKTKPKSFIQSNKKNNKKVEN